MARIIEPGNNKPVRLAMISNQAFSLVNFRGPLIREMVSRGIIVYAFASDYDAQSKASVSAIGAIPVDYSLKRTGMNPLRDVMDMGALAFKLRAFKIDISFAYFIKPVIYGTLAAWLARVPDRFVMIEGAGYVFTESSQRLSFKRRVLRFLVTSLYRVGLSRARKVFLLNTDDKKMFIETAMTSADKICLINGIGLDLNHFQELPPNTEPIAFILVARLLREKGIWEFVEAARKVKSLHPEITFYLIGDIDANPGSISEQQAQQWVEEGLLVWPGHVDDVRIWLAKASVFVLPSYREGLPRSSQEAMASGRPVITTDAPGCRETVRHGVNGFLVPVRDSESLAQAMLRFIAQPELIGEMGARSRQFAEENYNVQQINSIILAAMGL
jgi:glycosyltransferase involved in cell wall biosynthesis